MSSLSQSASADGGPASMPFGTAHSVHDHAEFKKKVNQIAVEIGRAAAMDDMKLTQFIISTAKQSSAALNSSRPADADAKMKEVLRAVVQRLFPAFSAENGVEIPDQLILDVLAKFPAFSGEMCANWELERKKKGWRSPLYDLTSMNEVATTSRHQLCNLSDPKRYTIPNRSASGTIPYDGDVRGLGFPRWSEPLQKSGSVGRPCWMFSHCPAQRLGTSSKKIDEEKLKEDLFKPGGTRDQFVKSDMSSGRYKWSMSLACGAESDSELEELTLDQKVNKILDKMKDVKKSVINRSSMLNKQITRVQEYLEKNLNTSSDEEEYSPINATTPASTLSKLPEQKKQETATRVTYVDDYCDLEEDVQDDGPSYSCRYDMSARAF
eukprot:g8773.t1